MIDAPQALHHGFFHNALAVGDAVELGPDGKALDREGVLLPQNVLPGERTDALEQLLKAAGLKGPQPPEHPLPAAEDQVGPGTVLLFPGKKHPAVFGLDFGKALELELVGHQALDPHETGDGKLHHIKTSLHRPWADSSQTFLFGERVKKERTAWGCPPIQVLFYPQPERIASPVGPFSGKIHRFFPFSPEK